ncbi:MAG: GGDEF domain-containing protein, partial [Rhizobiaceae bacterium]|nr:GGDEF domain-containing protein [Rhizobiaceae bacterium]
MQAPEKKVAADPPDSSLQMPRRGQNPGIMAEVEHLLRGRTRDIRLKDELLRLFEVRTWPRTAKIIRSWMIWVALLDVLTLGLNALLLPKAIVLSMIAPAALLPPAALATAFVWRRPRDLRFQRLFLMAGLFLILLSVALVGVSAGGEFYERHLNI